MAQGLRKGEEAGILRERSRTPEAESLDGDLFGCKEKTYFIDVS